MPPKSKPKRKAEEPIQSIDESKKEQKAQQEDVYMEPKGLCDLALKYDGVVFHVHKMFMFRESKYFKSLIEREPNVISVELPEVEALALSTDEKIGWQAFKGFLEFMYRAKEIEYGEVVLKADDKDLECGYYAVITLAHHFQVSRIEARMKVLMREAETRVAREDVSGLVCLLYAHTYGWTSEENFLIASISRNLLQKREEAGFKNNWDLLPVPLREQLLFGLAESFIF